MDYPASTGEVARELGTTEPRLNELIRRGLLSAPPVRSERRTWYREHVHDAARLVNRDREISLEPDHASEGVR